MTVPGGRKIVRVRVRLGLVAAVLATRVIESQLYGVPSTDLTSYVVAAAVLAVWLPVRRAVRMDPMSALRAE